MEQIAATFEQYRRSIDGVSRATPELDASTQQNAAMFEETNAALQLLDGAAKSLMKQVDACDIKNNRTQQMWTIRQSQIILRQNR